MVLHPSSPPLSPRLIGCTPNEVRERYGEPMIVQDHRKEVPDLKEFYWMYQRGWLGQSRIKFEDDAAVSVGHCPGHDYAASHKDV